ncbi:hypothetical protein [Jonesia quinghaiensis]|uniref:hypothetical protein n=1 Tax=Jonesia quinghaiensis TaxID=262806 RepID=UPI0004294F6F|nr:hypothetical protein [Jonesia quinghaiensis]
MQLDKELESEETRHAGFNSFIWAVIFAAVAELATGFLIYGALQEQTSQFGEEEPFMKPVLWAFLAFFGLAFAVINLIYGLKGVGHRRSVDLHIAAEQLRYLERIAAALDTKADNTKLDSRDVRQEHSKREHDEQPHSDG